MTEKQMMLAGKLYNPDDMEINKDFIRAKKIIRKINATTERKERYRIKLFRKLFDKVGENIWIETPFQCEFGYNISIGDNFFANYDCLIIDSGKVQIGNNVLFGPRVSLYTVGHPIDSKMRDMRLEYGKEIKIGDSVWIGGNTVINPGVEIGSNVVIGSGSIVTKEIPSGVVAAGNPCKIIRNISESDRKIWEARLNEYNIQINV